VRKKSNNFVLEIQVDTTDGVFHVYLIDIIIIMTIISLKNFNNHLFIRMSAN